MKNLMKTFSKSKLAIGLSTALLLSACGGTDQGEGTISTVEQVFGGQAIDGYLARATVFLDTNNDGTRNAWEPFAFTDNEGYYSYNPNTGTNYCATSASAEQAQYCLRTNTQRTDVVVRIDGGYDVTTGEPFVGQLSRRLTNVGEEGVNDTLVSPLSSLMTNVENASEQSTILSSLNLEMSDLDVNYLNTDGAGTVDSNVLNAAIKVHKVVTVLSDRLTDTYTEIGEEIGTQNDATSSVYPRLAEQLLSSGSNFDLTVQNATQLTTVLDNAENDLRQVYERKEFTLPADLGSVENPNGFNRVVDVADKLVDIVNTVIDPTSGLNELEAVGGLRAVESVVIKSLNEVGTDNSIDNAASFFMNSDTTLVESLLTSLSQDNADIVSLVNNDFTGTDFDSVDEVTQASSLPSDVDAFTQIGGLTLKVSDLDLGSAPNNLEDSEVEFYFTGATDDLSGAFSACVKHIDDASIDGTLGEGNTRGELIDGFWSLLGATEDNRESYSVLLTITFLGTTYQAILKPSGEETIADVTYKKLRFDNDGDLRIYHSAQGLVDTTTMPTTNEECEARLPSRVGI